MADRPPPSRYSVVERGGRLVVIDRDTGTVPLSAAERMAEHDRRMGSEPVRPAARRSLEEAAADLAPETIELVVKTPVPPQTPQNPRMAAAVAAINRKQPWHDRPRKPVATAPAPARIAQRPAPGAQAAGRKTIVTGKWWDAKGPRTIELSPQGQRELTGGFTTLFFVVLIAAIVALFIAPVVLFVGAFLAFRFGGKILGPIGAGIIDKAIAQKG